MKKLYPTFFFPSIFSSPLSPFSSVEALGGGAIAWRGSRGGGVNDVGLAVEGPTEWISWWRGRRCDLVILDDFGWF